MTNASDKRKLVYLDFEFNRTNSRDVNLVSCVTLDFESNKIGRHWLHNNPYNVSILKQYLSYFDTVVGWACVAEARSFLSLGLDPLKWDWIDLYLEYRMLLNHNDKLQWGNQLVDGVVKAVRKPKPKWERNENELASGFKPTFSLVEATYNLTKQIRDSAHKKQMRDLIISDPDEFDEIDTHDILEYNAEDVEALPLLWSRIQDEFYSLERSPIYRATYVKDAVGRGKYSALTAKMEQRGYPINFRKTLNFSKQVSSILFDAQREISQLFPKIKPFRWNRRENKYSWNQLATRQWLINNHDPDTLARWLKTDKGAYSLSLEAFERFYQFKHDYPKDNFGAQMVRYLKLKQSLYGFVPSAKGKSFWDSVGPDRRVRPYLNIFGAQSSRSQPAATGFMFLKPAWMRALVEPQPGQFLAGIDYSSVEFFISGLLAKDRNMIASYLSGDPYLAFGKLSKQIPSEGTKATHGAQRDLCKSTVLGLSYRMSKYGLKDKLTADTGRVWTEEEAQAQIDLFYDTYSNLKEYQEMLMEDYEAGGHRVRLPCGWTMWADNENLRSVVNVPIQGFGASVMRKAVEIAEERGCEVLFTLHDAIYIEGKIGDEIKIKILADAMVEAFCFYFHGDFKELAKNIRLDPHAWGPDYPEKGTIEVEGLKVPVTQLYIDARSRVEYEKFSKYFENRVEDEL